VRVSRRVLADVDITICRSRSLGCEGSGRTSPSRLRVIWTGVPRIPHGKPHQTKVALPRIAIAFAFRGQVEQLIRCFDFQEDMKIIE
jgi:hypothetical protein